MNVTESFAKVLATRINGGDWNDSKFYTDEQKQLWIEHSEFLQSALKQLQTPKVQSFAYHEPEHGEKYRFLNKNGYDSERARAAEAFKDFDLLTLTFCEVGGWHTDLTFEEVPGRWNSVMFELVK